MLSASNIEHFRSKFGIQRIIADLKQCLQETELLNVQYLALKPEIEYYKILKWYDVESTKHRMNHYSFKQT